MKKNFKTNVELPKLPDVGHSDLLNFYDPNNSDLNLFNMLDEENIRLSGSKLKFYKHLQGEEDFDPVYKETKGKIISPEPIIVWGHYDPTLIEENLTAFGLELTNDQMFTFNKTYIVQQLGREVIAGDQIEPMFRNVRFEIFEVQEDSFEMYGSFHLICSARILRDEPETLQRKPERQSDPLGGYSRK